MSGESDRPLAPFAGRVLVVDGDYDTLAAIARVLRQRGHHVVLAADGRAGLQRAVEVAADVVLVDRDVSVVDVRTFLEVLRDNPRTASAHVFVMGKGEPMRLTYLDPAAEPIVKPFNADEVAARVSEVLRVRRAPPREPELRGDLTQVALFDLLQVFTANRRTGRLSLHTTTATGEIWMRDGQIVDALFAGAAGEKALYRALAVETGRFVFAPGLEHGRVRIEASTDHLLMEGARHKDEAVLQLGRLPPLSALVSRAAEGPRDGGGKLAEDLRGHLDEPRSIDELLDLVSASDLEALRTIADMIESGELLIFDPEGQVARLCDEEEAIALRAAAARLRRPGFEGPVRVGVLAPSHEAALRFGRALSRVEEFVAAARAPVAAGEGAIGALGSLQLDGSDVELFVLPLDRALRPLWAPLLAPCSVVLSLVEGTRDVEATELLANLEVRVVEAPAGWERSIGAAAAVRAALAHGTPRSPDPR